MEEEGREGCRRLWRKRRKKHHEATGGNRSRKSRRHQDEEGRGKRIPQEGIVKAKSSH